MNVTSYPRTARLVNRFKLGADPEFVMHDPWGRYIHAETLGMTTLQGFGCDMAGRQAEIRAFPSRFALEVVGSIMDSLRWIGHVYPASLNNNWNAVAFNGKDGCGGHVHFGRRRPNRDADIQILDRVNQFLVRNGVYDAAGFDDRLARTHYGRYGDFRTQNHGYEYRTFPTQLASPWLTYFTLVVSKLAVFSGTMLVSRDGNSVIELLKRFQDRDDDAAIALQALKVLGMPQQINTDFKHNWGVSKVGVFQEDFVLDRHFFPSMLEPSDSSCEDLFELFVRGKELPVSEPVPNWAPYRLPDDVFRIQVQAHTLGHAPDIGMNLVSKGMPVSIHVNDRWHIFSPIALPIEAIRKAVGQPIEYAEKPDQSRIDIYIPTGANKSLTECRRIKGILSNTELFPVVKASNLATTSWGHWEQPEPCRIKEKKKAKLGKIIAHVTRQEQELRGGF